MVPSSSHKPRARTTKNPCKRSPSVKLGQCVLRFDRPKVMGIVNNTPDSFSGDGLGGDTALAIERGRIMLEAGAAVVDIGGASTRPGADPVPLELEKRRTIPVVEALSASYPGRISIDSMKPDVAQAALLAGAVMVNDVTGLRKDRKSVV